MGLFLLSVVSAGYLHGVSFPSVFDHTGERNRCEPPENPATAHLCSRPQERRQHVRKDELLRTQLRACTRHMRPHDLNLAKWAVPWTSGSGGGHPSSQNVRLLLQWEKRREEIRIQPPCANSQQAGCAPTQLARPSSGLRGAWNQRGWKDKAGGNWQERGNGDN